MAKESKAKADSAAASADYAKKKVGLDLSKSL